MRCAVDVSYDACPGWFDCCVPMCLRVLVRPSVDGVCTVVGCVRSHCRLACSPALVAPGAAAASVWTKCGRVLVYARGVLAICGLLIMTVHSFSGLPHRLQTIST